MFRPVRRLLACLLAMCATACAGADYMRPGPVPGSAGYDGLYPLYAEYCALSGIDKNEGFGASIHGGPGGHSVLYLNGACRDRDAHYPLLRPCDPNRPGEPRGAGISANSHFSNANWIASDGPDFFFQGTLRPGMRLTRAVYERTQARARALGILDGVAFHEAAFDDIPGPVRRTMPAETARYDVTVGTDYAVAFGRGRYCERVPLDRRQMARVIDALNAVNAPYRSGTRTYVWDVLRDNCTHLTHNALAAAGLWRADPVGRMALLAAFAFPVPKNDWVDLERATNDADLTDLPALYRDPATRLLLAEGRLPLEPGALAETAGVWPDNDLYRVSQALIFYMDPFFGRFQVDADRIETDPRYHDPRANLAAVLARYDAALAAARPADAWLAERPGLRAEAGPFSAFADRFHATLLARRDLAAATLRRLDGERAGPTPATTPGP